jgi:hypothetical protein
MVDREARDALAGVFAQLLTEGISPDEFGDFVVQHQTTDNAVNEIWFLYNRWISDDVTGERVIPPETIAPSERIRIERCILFLRYDLVYGWPQCPMDLDDQLRTPRFRVWWLVGYGWLVGLLPLFCCPREWLLFALIPLVLFLAWLSFGMLTWSYRVDRNWNEARVRHGWQNWPFTAEQVAERVA